MILIIRIINNRYKFFKKMLDRGNAFHKRVGSRFIQRTERDYFSPLLTWAFPIMNVIHKKLAHILWRRMPSISRVCALHTSRPPIHQQHNDMAIFRYIEPRQESRGWTIPLHNFAAALSEMLVMSSSEEKILYLYIQPFERGQQHTQYNPRRPTQKHKNPS